MRSHGVVVFVCAALLLFVFGSSRPAHAAEAGYFTLSGGWSWPVGGAVQDAYQSGFTLGASVREGVAANYMGGLEVGYTWYSLDTGYFEGLNPGSTISGGNMGMLSITTENDYIFGVAANPMRPFLNLGIGYYHSFVDGATIKTGATSTSFNPGVSSGSFFGWHAGVGALVTRARYGVRLDANYEHLFAGGPDFQYFTARAGIIFYIQTAMSGAPDQEGD